MASGDARNYGPLTGLSDFTRTAGTATALGSAVWVPVMEVLNIERTTRITGLQITLAGPAPTSPTYRISAKRQEDDNYRVIAPPASDGQDVVSGQLDSFSHPIHLPKGASYRVEVYTTTAIGGSTAEVTILNLIEFIP